MYHLCGPCLCLQYEKLGMGKWYPGKLLLQNQDRKLGEC